MGKIEDKDIDLHIDRETLLQEYIPRAEFEQRLKDDMVAMLEELKKSIEDKVYNVSAYSECLDCDVIDYEDVNEIIIEKINALKEANDDR